MIGEFHQWRIFEGEKERDEQFGISFLSFSFSVKKLLKLTVAQLRLERHVVSHALQIIIRYYIFFL